MKVSITLCGPAAPQIIRSIARSYALLHIRSRLTDAKGAANAPWFDVARMHRIDVVSAHRRWMRLVDRERTAYRETLESILGDAVPEPPAPEWPASNRNAKGVIYSPTKAAELAAAYAETVVWLALNRDGAVEQP